MVSRGSPWSQTQEESKKQREKKIMFQRVALTFYDTRHVRSLVGADKETTLPASIVKSHIFPFLSVGAGVVGGCDGN
jgi:hypothetical protein